ncbi:MAG: hypothetical protein ACREXX_09285 [Gammaproteobacteria bacterium]
MPNPNPSPYSDPEVLTRFQEELERAAALPGFASVGPALWPRFAGYYERLARLPRKARRALQASRGCGPRSESPTRCTLSRCDIRIQCNLDPASGAPCTNRIDIFVNRSAAR